MEEHVITCFIDDPVGVKNRHGVGIDTITWECDYPHSDTTWPKSPEILARSLEGVPDDEVDEDHPRERAAHLPPRCLLPSAEGEVHRRRRCAPSRPTSICPLKSQGGKPPVEGEVRPVTSQDVMQQLASVYSTQPE